MTPSPLIRLIIVTITLILVSALIAAAPSDNTIPTLAMRIRGPYVTYDDITISFYANCHGFISTRSTMMEELQTMHLTF